MSAPDSCPPGVLHVDLGPVDYQVHRCLLCGFSSGNRVLVLQHLGDSHPLPWLDRKERRFMDRHELVAGVREMRESAADYLRAYARLHARHVNAADVEAIAAALGEISLEEAVTALDRIELDSVPT